MAPWPPGSATVMSRGRSGVPYLTFPWGYNLPCDLSHDAFDVTPPGADPGFPIGGAPTLQVPTDDFAKFCEKLHEIEKILDCRGGTLGVPP